MSVPASTAIRRSRAHNITTDRLFRRRAFLIDLLILNGGRTLATRMDFAMRAAELTAIDNVLLSRGMLPRNHAAIRVQSDGFA
jgi:hypothetical protein